MESRKTIAAHCLHTCVASSRSRVQFPVLQEKKDEEEKEKNEKQEEEEEEEQEEEENGRKDQSDGLNTGDRQCGKHPTIKFTINRMPPDS
ncbi:hypothetical protein H920_01182 [Fukomys damarensis]|uniref:Uncharacterized protein n=1 Tax=Fukomys damarensis TaxID=885580 RepID=A0A091E3V4_FUKDA|nr:hypothetical protein H920_01182 [Fukomys damarensis]